MRVQQVNDAIQPAEIIHARLRFEQMLGYANHLGLYAEQTGPSGGFLETHPGTDDRIQRVREMG